MRSRSSRKWRPIPPICRPGNCSPPASFTRGKSRPPFARSKFCGRTIPGTRACCTCWGSLERARELNPGFWGPWFYLGKIEFQSKRAREAVPLLEKAAELNPGEASVYYQLGRALADCGRAEDAKHALDRVREINARAR